MFDKTRPYGTFYLVQSRTAGNMYYRNREEAKKYGLPTEVRGYPVFNKADKAGSLPVALFGSEAERDAAYPDPAPVTTPVAETPAEPVPDSTAPKPAAIPLFNTSRKRKRT